MKPSKSKALRSCQWLLIVAVAACGARRRVVPVNPAAIVTPRNRLPPPLVPRMPTEVVRWDNGSETVIASTPTLDPAAWPAADAGIWYVRPARRDLDANQLRAFVALAVKLKAPGISLSGFANADDASVAPMASQPASLSFVDLTGTGITDVGAMVVASLPGLRHAWFSSTAVSDATLGSPRSSRP